MSKKDIESQTYFFLLKLAMTVFMADVLFNTGETAISNIGIEFNFVFILKAVLILAFFIFIMAIQKKLFKIVGFLMVIFGSLYKIFDLISQIEFHINQLLDTAPYLFIIMFSFYYLFRSNKRQKYYHKHKSKTKSEEQKAEN